MDALLAAWDDATGPLDARVREDPLLFASQAEIAASSRVKRLKGPENSENCRPWDHADFLARVGSFRVAWWFAKPEPINAFECARHGWRNSAPDQLQCGCCKQLLCFKIDDKLSGAGALKVAGIFSNQLISGHTELCPWRGNPSPEAFMTLPIATKRQVYMTFMERLEEEVARMRKDDEFQKEMAGVKVVDAVATKVFKQAGGATPLDAAMLLPKLLARMSQDADQVSAAALVNAAFLVICGWRFDEKEDGQLRTLWCGSCNRRWQLFPETESKGGAEEDSEPPAKRLRAADAVDLLSQHRHFCPWVAGRKSTGVEDYGEIDPTLWEFFKLPGWTQYAQSLCFLGDPEEQSIVAVGAVETRGNDPVQALASVRAVLGI